MNAMLNDCGLFASLTGVLFPHIMEIIGEFVMENLSTLICSGGMLLVHQGLTSLSARRRDQATALDTRGDYVNYLKSWNTSLIMVTMLWLLASGTSQQLNVPACSSLPSSVQTAPAGLVMLACHQEVAPPHIAIYYKTFSLNVYA